MTWGGWGDTTGIALPTGRDCQHCQGKGTDPKKRKRACPDRNCHQGAEYASATRAEVAEYMRKLELEVPPPEPLGTV